MKDKMLLFGYGAVVLNALFAALNFVVGNYITAAFNFVTAIVVISAMDIS